MLAWQARETGICPVREELYAQCFDELIRQVTINCAERGLLLLRVRDEMRMSVAAYQVRGWQDKWLQCGCYDCKSHTHGRVQQGILALLYNGDCVKASTSTSMCRNVNDYNHVKLLQHR